MTPRIRLALVAAVTLLWLHPGHAQDRFDTELSFCATINTPMPDPGAPSFYTVMPYAHQHGEERRRGGVRARQSLVHLHA